MSESFSIYIHLPFCSSRCSYCDFVSNVYKNIPYKLYMDAITQEWNARKNLLKNKSPVSIYLGGGTPSKWPSKLLTEIIKLVKPGDSNNNSDLEITVEANPRDVTKLWVDDLLTAGVTRLSIGVQAMNDKRLSWLKRRHTKAVAKKAVITALNSKIQSVNADIIWGTPYHSTRCLKNELNELKSLGVHHISAYELTVAKDTPLFENLRNNKLKMPSEKESKSLFETCRNTLNNFGYVHYEVSNYALRGHESIHNKHYWDGGFYLGLGSGAHGFVPNKHRTKYRYANSNYLFEYMRNTSKIKNSHDCTGSGSQEIIDDLTFAKELIMLGLRTNTGVDFQLAKSLVPQKIARKWDIQKDNLVADNLAEFKNNKLVPTENGILLSDYIAQGFF